MRRRLGLGALALSASACGKGATDSTPPLPLTAVSRVEVQLPADSVLLGDSVAATLRAVNREGRVVSASSIVWSTTDSTIGAVTGSGTLRARNVGTVRLDVLADGIVGNRTVRVVPRTVRVTLVAPDSAELIDAITLSSVVETTVGVRLAEVAPRFAVSDSSIARITPTGVGTASVRALAPGSTDLLAIIGRDTTRRRFVVRVTPLNFLRLAIPERVVGVGDSVPYSIAAVDTLGRNVQNVAASIGFAPAGSAIVRNGHVIGVGIGRVVVTVVSANLTSRDTITVQGASEFPLEIVDGDGQNPLPLKVLLSMERVAAKWRRAIRSAPPGEFVSLRVGECRNAVPVSQFINGIRVLLKLDTLPANVAGRGGPCVVRSSGLPLLGTISLNLFNYNTLSDRKLDDLIQHEVGHVLGLGTTWGRGTLAGLISGDSSSLDPIFVGPNALLAFPKIGNSARFTGRSVPLELRVLGHWRGDVFRGEVMAPALISAVQPTSAVTVAALRDLGWNVELEAYEDFTLPEAVLTINPRVIGSSVSLESDMLLPKIMIDGGRHIPIDARGRPVMR